MSRSSPTGRANLIKGDANPLTDGEITTIIRACRIGTKYREIAEVVGRPLGTVKTALSRLRLAGIVEYRYRVGADA